MANPSVSIDIETPSTVYTLPPPPKYSEIYQKSNPLPDPSTLPSSNPTFEQRQTRLIGPPQPNLPRNPPVRSTTSNNHQSHYESHAVTRHRRDIIVTRCCFSLPLLVIIIIYAIVRLITDS